MSLITILSSPAPFHSPTSLHSLLLEPLPCSGIITENGQKTETPQKSGEGSEQDRSDWVKPDSILWPTVLSVQTMPLSQGATCVVMLVHEQTLLLVWSMPHDNEGRERSNT